MRRVALALGLLCIAGAWPGYAAEPLIIRSVSRAPFAFDPTHGEHVKVQFQLSREADVTLSIYDGRDFLVRAVPSDGALPPGQHSLTWKGRGASGKVVPPEAYHYTLEARAPDGGQMTWDATDTTGGERLAVDAPVWNADAGVVRYTLPKAARVRLRLGIENHGPLVDTLRDWVPRSAGAHEEAWNGRDQDGLIDYTHHPKLKTQIEAVALPQNSVLVLPESDRSTWIAALSSDHTPRRTPQERVTRQRLVLPPGAIPAHQSLEIEVSTPQTLERTKDGALVVTHPVGIAVDVDEAQRAAALSERLEVTLFVDGTYVFENEVGFLPFTWNWDPQGLGEGTHYLTVNLGGYMGRFGVKTVKVDVRSATRAASTEGR